MKGLAEYIEKKSEHIAYDDILLQFQRKLLEEGTAMEARTKKAGLSDESVLLDLFISEHADPVAEYEVFRKAQLKKNAEKRMRKFLLIGAPVWLVLMVIVYLAVSFVTLNWSQSWLIIIGFVTVLVDFIGFVFVPQIVARRKLLYPIARGLIALAVMMTTTCIFLIGNSVYHIPDFWVMFPGGVLVLLICDAVFACYTGQMLRNINYILYIVAGAAMLYVVLGGSHAIPWNPGWMIVPLSLVVDAVYVAIRLIHNRKYTYRPGRDDA